MRLRRWGGGCRGWRDSDFGFEEFGFDPEGGGEKLKPLCRECV